MQCRTKTPLYEDIINIISTPVELSYWYFEATTDFFITVLYGSQLRNFGTMAKSKLTKTTKNTAETENN